MRIVTRGMGKGSMLVTRGYGLPATVTAIIREVVRFTSSMANKTIFRKSRITPR